MKTTRLNNIYHLMIARCYTPTNNRYKYYGGRGIRVCDEWLDTELVPGTHHCYKGWLSFKEWALKNGYDNGLTIDRINVDENYCPSNCRWVSIKEQANNKTNNRFITYKDKTQTLAQWCEELNMDADKIRARLDRSHWSVEQAFETQENPRLNYITYNGKTQSLRAWCKELNLNYRTVISRLYQHHWTIKDAFEGKEDSRVNYVEYKGKRQPIKDWCKELGLDYRKVVNKIYRTHWPAEKVFEELKNG